MTVSPTQRSLKAARELGWAVEVVEKWIPIPSHPAGGVRKDLFGAIDLVAIADGRILGIQATSGANHAARREKALAIPELRAWVAAGAELEVWSWAKRGDRGKRKLWTLRREALGLGDFMAYDRLSRNP